MLSSTQFNSKHSNATAKRCKKKTRETRFGPGKKLGGSGEKNALIPKTFLAFSLGTVARGKKTGLAKWLRRKKRAGGTAGAGDAEGAGGKGEKKPAP